MEAFVQMPLETYDVLKYNNEYLKEKEVKEAINKLKKELKAYE